MSQTSGIQMQPLPSYAAQVPKRMASKDSVTSEGSLYLEPTPRNSANLPGSSNSNRGSLPGEHDSGVVDVDGLHPEFLSESSTLPKHSSTLSSSSQPSQLQKGTLPYIHPGQGHPQSYMMKRPDSFAGKGHEYEELPHSRYINPGRPYYNDSESGSGDSRPLPPPINKLVALNSSATGSRGSLENLCDATGAEKPPNVHRRRQNPLYDSVEHEEVQDFKSKPRKADRCSCLVQIMIAVIAVAALFLAILSLAGTTNDEDPKTSPVIQPLPNNSALQEALQRIRQLEESYEDLLQKHEALQLYVNDTVEEQSGLANEIEALANTSSIHEGAMASLKGQVEGLLNVSSSQQESLNNLTKELQRQQSQFDHLENTLDGQNTTIYAVQAKTQILDSQYSDLQSVYSKDIEVIQQNMSTYSQKATALEKETQDLATSLTMTLSDLESSLEEKIDDVSKMAGPPGVGNLTACQRRTKSFSSSTGTETTETAWIPESSADAEAYVIMGIECTTEGGTQSHLVSKAAPWDFNSWQYKCMCSGENSAFRNRKCELVYWTCPRLS